MGASLIELETKHIHQLLDKFTELNHIWRPGPEVGKLEDVVFPGLPLSSFIKDGKTAIVLLFEEDFRGIEVSEFSRRGFLRGLHGYGKAKWVTRMQGNHGSYHGCSVGEDKCPFTH